MLFVVNAAWPVGELMRSISYGNGNSISGEVSGFARGRLNGKKW